MLMFIAIILLCCIFDGSLEEIFYALWQCVLLVGGLALLAAMGLAPFALAYVMLYSR